MVSPRHGHLVCAMHIADRSQMQAAEAMHPLQALPPTVSVMYVHVAYRIGTS